MSSALTLCVKGKIFAKFLGSKSAVNKTN